MDEMIVSVPVHELYLMEGIAYCTTGVAKPSREFEEACRAGIIKETSKEWLR